MATDAQVTEKEARALAEESREKGWAKPSFCKELFLGRFRLDLIHPHPKPDAESIEKADKFLARLREYCETLDGTVIEREARIPDEYVKGLAELGCFGIKIPEEYGGLAQLRRSLQLRAALGARPQTAAAQIALASELPPGPEADELREIGRRTARELGIPWLE